MLSKWQGLDNSYISPCKRQMMVLLQLSIAEMTVSVMTKLSQIN
jgi:hypothetical protein